MKARYSLCIISALAVSLAASGQVPRQLVDPSRGSSATVFGEMEGGGFRSGYAASSLWKAGAKASSSGVYGKTLLAGSFSFEEMRGKDMMTSVFTSPGYYPIDVLEFTPGDKTMQTYAFTGGIFHPLSDRISAGAFVDYSAGNYSKRKDIRHTNYSTGLSLSPTMVYNGDGMRIAASLIFRKTAESIEAEQIGTATADTYYAFLDKGLRYGSYQAWDGSGIHLAEAGINRLPVKEFSGGGALRFDIKGTSVEFGYLRSSGTVGEKGYDWFRFPGNRFSARISRKSLIPAWGDNKLEINASSLSQTLEEAVIDKVSEGGVTLPVIYGYNRVSWRRISTVSVIYDIRTPDSGIMNSARILFSANFDDEQSSLTYPYTDEFHGSNYTAGASITLYDRRKAVWDRFLLTIGGHYRSGNSFERGLRSSEPDVTASEPFRLIGDWERKKEWMTSPRIGLEASLRYIFTSVKGLSVSLEGEWLHGLDVVLLPGTERFRGTIKLDYSF